MAQLTSGTGTRGGRRKRKKKYKHKHVFSTENDVIHRFHECYQRAGLCSNYVISGSLGRFITLKPWITSSVNSFKCAFSNHVHCDFRDTSLAHCDTHYHAGTHSTTHVLEKTTSRFQVQRTRSLVWAGRLGFRSRCDIFSVLALWLTSHALLTTTHTSFTADAAALPSPQYFSAPSSSSNKRHMLVPVSSSNNSIFLSFNPPAISNLKVNTRQIVSFSFTLYPRQFQFGASNNIKPTKLNKTGKTSILGHELGALSLSNGYAGISTTTTKTSNSIRNSNSKAIPILKSNPSTSSAVSNTTFLPPERNKLDNKSRKNGGSMYWVMIYSDDDTIARPTITSSNRQAVVYADTKGTYMLMAVWAGRMHNFSVEARHIGRVTMSVAVVNADGDRRMFQASYVQAVAASQYPITAVRGERTADLVFNGSAAAIAIIISFGIGAVTDADSVKRQLKYPVSLIIGFCSEFIIMPLLAFGVAMMLPLDKDIRFGLLCVACVPGGGISHVAVIIADGDPALSLTMNLISVVAMLGTAPLWIFVLGQYFQTDPQSALNPRIIPIFNFEVWLVSIFLAYAAGLAIKRLRPTIADAILMWLIKPFLLLASILYITLGVYINMYVFEIVNGYALLAAMLLPLSGCVLGGILAALCRQSYAFVKTIALETSSVNCLVVIVALRFSLKQPDADLAAVIPLWVMFTIPGFFVFIAVCNKVKNILLGFWRNRGKKDSDAHSSSKAYSVSSSMVSPPGTTTLSAPLVTADGMDDDTTISTTSNQKVTVL